jgi:dihydroanticapsin dehydrogenase
MTNRERYKDKVVVVTGGASGIGKAIATQFAREAATVVVADRQIENDIEIAPWAQELPGNVLFQKTDITDEAQIARHFDFVKERFGALDVLVNNAASFILRSVDATVEDWTRILQVNIIGTALCSQYASEMMKPLKQGSIVNISSISGFVAQSNQMTYNATKAAIVAMTRCMALDLSPYKIRVNCVAPGYTLTPQVRRDIELNGMTVKQAQKEWGGRHILKRMAEPDEIAPAVLFLASDEEASFITGETLMVDGGYTTL